MKEQDELEMLFSLNPLNWLIICAIYMTGGTLGSPTKTAFKAFKVSQDPTLNFP